MEACINDWESFWDNKAKSDRDFAATGRAIMDELGFLHTYAEICRHLSFSSEDVLLDVGCGTGLFALAISPQVSRIDCIDLSPNMVGRAQKNLNGIENVSVWRASILETSASPGSYEKCLAYSVIQYLQDMNELESALAEIYRILKPKGVALVAGIPDAKRKRAYEKKIWEMNESHSYEIEKKNSTLILGSDVDCIDNADDCIEIVEEESAEFVCGRCVWWSLSIIIFLLLLLLLSLSLSH